MRLHFQTNRSWSLPLFQLVKYLHLLLLLLPMQLVMLPQHLLSNQMVLLPRACATAVVGYMADRLEKFMEESTANWKYAKGRDEAFWRFLSSARLGYYPVVLGFPNYTLHDFVDEEHDPQVDDDTPAH